MKKTKQPIVLTVNGRADLVVMDAGSYEGFLAEKDRVETIASIRRGLADARAGRVTPAEQFFEEFEKKHGISRD